MIETASPRNDFAPLPPSEWPSGMPLGTPQSLPQPLGNGEPWQRAPNASPQINKNPAQQLEPEADEVVIAVMGATGSGKTTFINTVSGSQMRISGGLRSCTNVVQVAPPFILEGRSVTLIDTPGFDDTTKSDTDILRMIAHFLTTTYEHGKKLAGVIYIHRISDFRMGGISTRNFRMFRELCGDSTLKNVVIITNMWGQVSTEVGEARERELAADDLFFKPVLDKGAQMLRHDHTLASANKIIKYFLENKPLVLQIQREIVDEKKDILQTSAGGELNRELILQMNKHKEEMGELQKEWQAAMDAKDEETRREIEAEAKKLKQEMDRVERESQKLATNFQKEKEELEKRMKTMDAEARKEQKRLQDEHMQQLNELEAQRRADANQSREAQQRLGKQIEALRNRPRRGGFFSSLGRAIDGVFGL